MHIATVTWTPEFDAEHIGVFETEHSHKSCMKNDRDPVEISFDCDIRLPESISHMVTGDTEDAVMRAARTWAYGEMPTGTDYRISYVGRLAV